MTRDRWYLALNRSEVENAYAHGRVSDRDMDDFLRAWTWGAPRFSGVAGLTQSAYEHRHGTVMLNQRIQRVKAAIRAVGQVPVEVGW